jgi:hypothetical protein
LSLGSAKQQETQVENENSMSLGNGNNFLNENSLKIK